MSLDPKLAELETLPLRIAIELRKRGVMDDRDLLVFNIEAAKRLERLGLLPDGPKL